LRHSEAAAVNRRIDDPHLRRLILPPGRDTVMAGATRIAGLVEAPAGSAISQPGGSLGSASSLARLDHAIRNEGGADMATLDIEPLHPEFGARIKGVNLRTDLDGARLDAIREAIDTYSFLVFEGQSFDDAAQLELTRAIGEPEPSHVARGEGRLEYFGTIGNVQPDGTTVGNSHKKTIFLTGNNMWHTDASFKPTPAFLSIMCAYETPAEGGETLFVSTRRAYERMADDRKAEADPLIVIHDYVYSRSKVAPDAVSPGLAATLPPVRQRLVRRNPRHGAKNLFIGSHARSIEGWSDARSRTLLDGLVEEATAEPHVYRHRWQPGQVVFWDNRCLIHRGAGYDADRFRRYMRQTRVSGAGSTLAE